MPMCENYMERIGALIDDELSAEQRLEVMEHIAHCPACKAYWEELLLIRDALREPVQSAPAGFADAVMARVRETAQETSAAAEKKIVRFPQWKRFAGLVACCALVALGVFAMDFLPWGGSNSASEAAVRNGAAPQAEARDDSLTGSAAESYAVNGGGNPEADQKADGAAYDAETESPAEMDNYGLNELAASLSTGSETAARWVEEHLGEVWESGGCYALSEEQYNELRKLLTEAGDRFTEIMGNENGSSYQLLAE